MVSLEGAKAAEPLVDQIEKLQVVHDQLHEAATACEADTGTPPKNFLWKFDLQIYVNTISQTISLEDNFSPADSAAILFSLRNIIGTKIAVLTNELGAIA